VASKSAYASEEKGAEIEEQLDLLDKLLDRVKVLYEQYFMGIQKQAPSHLHTEAERRLRELTQLNIRNTALRYRFATLQQKFGAYNTYWKRTLREIEGGRYMRNLSKVRRQAQMTGEDIPEEILAKMPKRMRDAVARDREVALAKAARAGQLAGMDGAATVDDRLPEGGFDDGVGGPSDTQPDLAVPQPALKPPVRGGAHRLDDPFAGGGDADGDIADMLTALADEALAAVEKPAPAPPVAKAAPGAVARPPAAPPPRPTTPPPPPPPRATTPPPLPPRATTPPPAMPRTADPPTAVTTRQVVQTVRRATTDTVPSPPPRQATVPPASAPRPAPAPAARPAAARPAAARPAAAASGPIPGMSEADTRSLYARYIKAREVVGEKTDPMSYDKLLRTLSSQAPKILEQHKASGVEFNVVIKDNKVVLKAKPK
jgi:outer membrane biosynthesis protein TonB